MSHDPYHGQYVALRTEAKQIENIERALMAMENQVRAFTRDGMDWATLFPVHLEYAAELRRVRAGKMRNLGRAMRGTPLAEGMGAVHGIGDALFFVLGLLPPLQDFDSPAKVWAYAGLDVALGGSAPKRKSGQRHYERSNGKLGSYNPRLRAYALYRLAEPIVKVGGPYRALYDARKEHTMETHPPMREPGEGCEFCDRAYGRTAALRAEKNQTRERKSVAFDCANLGGIHWTKGHRHADALRYMAKAILCDAWRVAHGLAPRVGQFHLDAHSTIAQHAA